MGLFDRLLGKDPTGDWPAGFAAPLEYDFDRHALCGVRIGSAVEAFRAFGRAEDPAKARKGMLWYYSKGFYVSVENGRAVDFVLFWTDDWTDAANRPQPFRGKCRMAGREVRLDASTTEAELVGWLGEPDARDTDGDGYLNLRFRRDGGVVYDADLRPDGGLREIIVKVE